MNGDEATSRGARCSVAGVPVLTVCLNYSSGTRKAGRVVEDVIAQSTYDRSRRGVDAGGVIRNHAIARRELRARNTRMETVGGVVRDTAVGNRDEAVVGTGLNGGSIAVDH